MACLTDLKVKKVSFVRRGANRREFFLAKSADFNNPSTGRSGGDNNKEAHHMRPEVRLKLGEILKAERDSERVCALLKEDTMLKMNDSEIAEVRDFVSVLPTNIELEKAKTDLQKAEADKTKAETELARIRDEQHKAEVRKWVDENCKYLSGVTPQDAVEQILKAEKVDPATAETLKRSFQSTSDALKASALLKEVGSSGEDYDPIGGGIVSEVSKIANELKKSGGNAKQSETVLAAIRTMGSGRYEAYRKEFNRRARTY